MKKLSTLLIAIGAFVTMHAQSSKDEARRVVLGEPKTTTSQQGRTVVLGKTPHEQQRKIYKKKRTVYYGKNSNRGKHLGWYKGVGNPHRYGVQPGKGIKKWKHKRHED